MSRLIMIRHGQASFLSDDYDKLSTLGVEQAQQLGEYWRAQQMNFDAVFCGPRRRHRETADRARECLQVGHPWPEMSMLPELDEHHVDQLVAARGSQLSSHSPELFDRVEAFDHARTDAERHRRFQQLFEAAARLWIAGEEFDIEPWDCFRARVNRVLDDIVRRVGHGQTVLVFTSVGPVTVAVQRAMLCSDQIALQTGWRLWNCSLTEFVFSGARFSLDCFNAMPHLSWADRTYR